MARLADYEIESMWKSAVKHGITLDGDHVDVGNDVTAANVYVGDPTVGCVTNTNVPNVVPRNVAPLLRVAAVV